MSKCLRKDLDNCCIFFIFSLVFLWAKEKMKKSIIQRIQKFFNLVFLFMLPSGFFIGFIFMLSLGIARLFVFIIFFTFWCLAVTSQDKESKERECWNRIEWRLNSENDSISDLQEEMLIKDWIIPERLFVCNLPVKGSLITNEIAFTVFLLVFRNSFFGVNFQEKEEFLKRKTLRNSYFF